MYSSVKWLSRVWMWTILCLPLLPFGEREEKHRDHQRRHEKACVLTTHLPYLIGAQQTWLGPIWRTIRVFHRRDVSQSCMFGCLRCWEADQHSLTTLSSWFFNKKTQLQIFFFFFVKTNFKNTSYQNKKVGCLSKTTQVFWSSAPVDMATSGNWNYLVVSYVRKCKEEHWWFLRDGIWIPLSIGIVGHSIHTGRFTLLNLWYDNFIVILKYELSSQPQPWNLMRKFKNGQRSCFTR